LKIQPACFAIPTAMQALFYHSNRKSSKRRGKMKCIKCGSETSGGRQYRFYFGKHAGTDYPTSKVTRTSYQMGGSEEVFLCDPCVDGKIERRARLTAGGVFLVTLLLSFLRLSMGPAPQGSEMETVIGFPAAFIFGLVIYLGIRKWKNGRQKEDEGDRLAIQVRKPDLKLQGYDAYFGRADYKRLN
jgi:hypothetical protein